MEITTRIFEDEAQRQEWVAWLKTQNLIGANLYRANLREADLREADLIGADLTQANLIGADLTQANLYRADLIGADLREANLRGAYLTQADLRGADLYRADLTDIRVSWVSHTLLAEILRRAAGADLLKQALASLIDTHFNWCWADWTNDSPPEDVAQEHWDLLVTTQRAWAIEVLTPWLREDQIAPWAKT